MYKYLSTLIASLVFTASSFASSDSFLGNGDEEDNSLLSLLPKQDTHRSPWVLCLEGIVVGSSKEEIRDEVVKGIEVKNLSPPFPVQQLRSCLQPFLGRSIEKSDLIAMKRAIFGCYRDQGYPFIYVYVPEQEVTQGVIRFVVVEGRLNEIKFEGCGHFSEKFICRQIDLKPSCKINIKTLTKELDWLNRNPFRKIDAVFIPSQQDGYTDLILKVRDNAPFVVSTGVDNTGLQHTGNARWFAGFTWGNAFNCDQILSYQFTTASSYNNFWSHSLHYAIPLSWRHQITLFGGYSRVKARLAEEQQQDMLLLQLGLQAPDPLGFTDTLESHGYATQASLRYEIPFKSYSGVLQEIVGGFDFKRTNTNLTFQGVVVTEPQDSVNLTQLLFGYNMGVNLGWLKYFLLAELFISPGKWLPDQSNKDYEKIRPGAKNRYAYARFAVEPIFCLPKAFTLETTWKVQLSSTNLLASEQFGLGGYNTVRGYEERIVNTDNAVLINLTLKTPPISLFRLVKKLRKECKDCFTFLAFYDLGYGYDHEYSVEMNGKQENSALLMGIGPGIRYTVGHGVIFRGDFGFQLKRVPGDTGSPYKFHFGLTANF